MVSSRAGFDDVEVFACECAYIDAGFVGSGGVGHGWVDADVVVVYLFGELFVVDVFACVECSVLLVDIVDVFGHEGAYTDLVDEVLAFFDGEFFGPCGGAVYYFSCFYL